MNVKSALALGLLLLSSSASAQTGRYISNEGLSLGPISTGKADGKMDNKPYSASYLPKKEGQLSKENDAEIADRLAKGWGDCDLVHQVVKDNAAKATTEKFDAAFKGAGLTDDYNKNGYDKKAQYWEGFCHLWSPAGLDPNIAFITSMDRIYAKVPFGIGDLRELSTYNYPDKDALFFGTRNYGSGSKKASQNLDPVDLLTIFQTYVGHGKPGVVLDIDPSAEVWNQPFYSWDSKTKELTGDDAKGKPADGHAYEVKLHATYAKETDYAYRGDTVLYESNWTMRLYTDKDGKVTDSKFVKDESDDIPDFAWVPTGKAKGTNLSRLQKIAKKGVAVKDIEAFCKGMQKLTKASFKTQKSELAKLLSNICPVLDQNKLSAYEKKIAAKTGIDYSVLDSALQDPPDDNS